MFDDIDNQINSVKKILRKKSENYIENFNKIKHFINIEIEEIKKLKKLELFFCVSQRSSNGLFNHWMIEGH